MVPAHSMKAFYLPLIAAFACIPTFADIPKKAPLVKYSGLWNNSPFTSKPPPPPPGVTVNPFEDFTLTGIAPVPGGYRITVMSKKNPDIKKVIEPGGNSEFKVISVNRNPDKALGTTVVLSSGAIQGTVTFEPDLITLKAAPTAPTAPQANPNLPPGINNPNQAPQPTNPNGTATPRQPRPRIVPPPTPSANTQPQQPQNQGDTRRDIRRR